MTWIRHENGASATPTFGRRRRQRRRANQLRSAAAASAKCRRRRRGGAQLYPKCQLTLVRCITCTVHLDNVHCRSSHTWVCRWLAASACVSHYREAVWWTDATLHVVLLHNWSGLRSLVLWLKAGARHSIGDLGRSMSLQPREYMPFLLLITIISKSNKSETVEIIIVFIETCVSCLTPE